MNSSDGTTPQPSRYRRTPPAGRPARMATERVSIISVPITSRLSTTSTSDSALAAAGLMPRLNSVKISVVNVWNRRISKAPYSASRPSSTIRQPPSRAALICGSTAPSSARNRPRPSDLATSYRELSTRRSAAATGR